MYKPIERDERGFWVVDGQGRIGPFARSLDARVYMRDNEAREAPRVKREVEADTKRTP